MDAVEFLKTAYRMCDTYGRECDSCRARNACFSNPTDRRRNPEGVVAAVEQWGKDHPVKTRQSEFLERFPNAQMVNIERTFCVAYFDSTKKCKENIPSDEQCIACRYKFWNEEVTDND